jgi:hypothetical protein
MNGVASTVRRYAASATLAQDGAEVIAVVDRDGGLVNAAAWDLLRVSRDDPALWEDLLPPVRALRGRLLTQPQAATAAPGLIEAANEVIRQARLLRAAVASTDILDRLIDATRAVLAEGSPLGEFLLSLLDEGTIDERVVVAASRKAQAALATWLEDWEISGVRVLTAGELGKDDGDVGRVCVVGPPRFYKSSLVTAPAAGRLCFLVPSWFRDLSIPHSPFAPHAEGAIEVKTRVRKVDVANSTDAPPDTPAPAGVETESSGTEEELLPPSFLPTPPRSFSLPHAAGKRSRGDVAAHKLILSGGLAMWLDDGEHIRALDPVQPTGKRVIALSVQDVRPGTILLLREGQGGDREMLRTAAYELLGSRAAEVRQTQEHWKSRLAELLDRQGDDRVERDLTTLGAEHAGQVRAWTDRLTIRPRSDVDFRVVLQWLDIPVEPSYGNAGLLRQATAQAGKDVTNSLEIAINIADLSGLDQQGYLVLDGLEEGIRGMIATRVLSMSENMAFVPRSKARDPFKEGAAQWHE